jgi:hypothetical protein
LVKERTISLLLSSTSSYFEGDLARHPKEADALCRSCLERGEQYPRLVRPIGRSVGQSRAIKLFPLLLSVW